MFDKLSNSPVRVRQGHLGVILVILGLSILSCIAIFWVFTYTGSKQQSGVTCPALPQTFKETDILGTWKADYRGGLATDTIILKGDGKYKQIFDAPEAGFHYEGDWHEWWVEYRKSGYIRLHLEEMRRCDDSLDVCQREGGGTPYWNIDYCENVDVQMENGVILIITGASEKSKATGKILLRQTRLAGSEWSYAFRLR